MPFVRVRDQVVHYTLTGASDAPVLMLANSLGTNLHVWDAQVDAFAASHRVLRYDMRGHGLTAADDPNVPATTVAELADDVAGLLDTLEIPRVRFVGLSLGGLVAQRFAAAYPRRVESLVLCGTANRMGPPEVWTARITAIANGGMSAIVEGVMARWFTPRSHAERPELMRGFGTMLERTPAAGYIAGCRAVQAADLRHDDGRITAPTLVVGGRLDLVATPILTAELCAAIPGAEMLTLEHSAHILCAEEPEAFNEAVLRFLTAAKLTSGGKV
ncbi:MAG TPA: 3-oxoadipate enol-lactonase [Candidatus Acidoferrum sp.]|nr:3-oxoadipate enol-lactonase [Candidatus Acidoferrum sp.]